MTYDELEDWKYVHYRMEEEGFHYCFKHYSNFEEIKDDEFHLLRLNYLESAKVLEDYVNNKCDEGY
jgi:hypothetical protein